MNKVVSCCLFVLITPFVATSASDICNNPLRLLSGGLVSIASDGRPVFKENINPIQAEDRYTYEHKGYKWVIFVDKNEKIKRIYSYRTNEYADFYFIKNECNSVGMGFGQSNSSAPPAEDEIDAQKEKKDDLYLKQFTQDAADKFFFDYASCPEGWVQKGMGCIKK